MKPAPFTYHSAVSLEEALQLLDPENGDTERKVIAGGQTLVPLMAMRLTRPSLLIDLNGLDELVGIDEGDSSIIIGAMTRQRDVERAAIVLKKIPLLAHALHYVGHIQTRNRGTIGGSLVHGDPSAEIPLVAVVLAARLHLASAKSRRIVDAEDFFEGPMTTSISDDEILTAIEFPLPPAGLCSGTSFQEIAPRHGDFALVSAGVQIALDDDGVCQVAHVGVGGCGMTPLRLHDCEAALMAGDLEHAIALVSQAIDPENTPQADAAYRRRVAPELVRRAVADAYEDVNT